VEFDSSGRSTAHTCTVACVAVCSTKDGCSHRLDTCMNHSERISVDGSSDAVMMMVAYHSPAVGVQAPCSERLLDPGDQTGTTAHRCQARGLVHNSSISHRSQGEAEVKSSISYASASGPVRACCMLDAVFRLKGHRESRRKASVKHHRCCYSASGSDVSTNLTTFQSTRMQGDLTDTV